MDKNRRPLKGRSQVPSYVKASVSDQEISSKTVYLFCDEFTNYNDTEIGIKAILLLEKLGYNVVIPKHEESGRAWLSKGLLRDAKKIAQKNISAFKSGFTILTNSCNTCHKATQHEFNVIKIPDSPPFSNQEFRVYQSD